MALIARHRPPVQQPGDATAREQMAYAQFWPAWRSANASLGYVHAMAHQLGGFYDLPRRRARLLLPHVERFNLRGGGGWATSAAPWAPTTPGWPDWIRSRRSEAGAAGRHPAHLHALGVKPEDFDTLARNASEGRVRPDQPGAAHAGRVIGASSAAY